MLGVQNSVFSDADARITTARLMSRLRAIPGFKTLDALTKANFPVASLYNAYLDAGL